LTRIELVDVERAAQRLAGVAHRTPVLTSRTLDERTGANVFCKAENLQRAGAFKFRGAYNAIAAMSADTRARGVAAFSSGNHAQAVALAASLHDIPAVIVMPDDAPPAKLAATKGYGAEIICYNRYTEDRTQIATDIAEERGLPLISPFDDWNVMAGQGTAALELFDEVGTLDTLVVCVGGGGLISGCATVAKAQAAPVRVVGVEPATGDDIKRSLAAGAIVTIDVPVTIADGQQTTAPSEKTFSVIRERVDHIDLVTDDELIEAMRFAFERMKIVLEPSGASALASVLAGHLDLEGQRVGVILSGGNVDRSAFARYLEPAID
jgi:threonine dehydratase